MLARVVPIVAEPDGQTGVTRWPVLLLCVHLCARLRLRTGQGVERSTLAG
jgi:hypothetical protein